MICFMTVLHHIRSDNLSFRVLALYSSRTVELILYPSERNLKDGERDKFDRRYLRIFLQKYKDKLTRCIGNIFYLVLSQNKICL